MRIVREAAIYFALVFGAGFVFGAIRVPFVVPRLGVRAAELLELPLMLVVIALVSRWRQRRTPELRPAQQLLVGVLALVLVLVAEFGLGFVTNGRSPREILAAHDPVSGPCFYASLLVFALLPWWWAARAQRAAAASRRATD